MIEVHAEWVTRLRVSLAGLFVLASVPASDGLISEGPKLTVRGSLAPLRTALGTDRRIGIIAWGPDDARARDQLTELFSLATRTGIDTVWISGYRFLKLMPAQQQELLDRANKAGLETVGFIDGDFDWPQEPEFVSRLYRGLTQQLSLLELGALKVAFAVDIEPHNVPKADRDRGKKWDGNLAPAMDLIEQAILPLLDTFAKSRAGTVEGPLLTRFEPFWYRNGHKPDDHPALIEGTILKGLRPIPRTRIAGMTYRDSAGGIAAVSEGLFERVEQEEVTAEIGVETIEREAAIGFFGKERQIGPSLLGVYLRMQEDDQGRLGGVFIHTGGIDEAVRILTAIDGE